MVTARGCPPLGNGMERSWVLPWNSLTYLTWNCGIWHVTTSLYRRPQLLVPTRILIRWLAQVAIIYGYWSVYADSTWWSHVYITLCSVRWHIRAIHNIFPTCKYSKGKHCGQSRYIYKALSIHRQNTKNSVAKWLYIDKSRATLYNIVTCFLWLTTIILHCMYISGCSWLKLSVLNEPVSYLESRTTVFQILCQTTTSCVCWQCLALSSSKLYLVPSLG